ncbi:hypothetical protein ISU10_06030 [Nocardioides agariphilus]|jgi:hypothetical protein|uniref:Uncharacterized protein n=1 Tax=Nocardioides agariphilus TaxID=433664 RepID=A0A930YG87_9ACTN|nr:hypothetical protein [Nocardioides agariphilus]MBF4767321.1 hypothetical protein [Nocardioides agariphilus]
MSITPVADGITSGSPVRRVRHQAREAAGLMAFSAVTSVGIATALLLLAHWGR